VAVSLCTTQVGRHGYLVVVGNAIASTRRTNGVCCDICSGRNQNDADDSQDEEVYGQSNKEIGDMGHPAKYSEGFIEVMAEILREDVENISMDGGYWVLDPMAGVGGIFEMENLLPVTCYGIELEQEYAAEGNHVRLQQGDARNLPFANGVFDAIIVSPAYGNRMADKILPTDVNGKYKRITYANSLERNLSEGNGAGVQWGAGYRQLHADAWSESVRVLKRDGYFLLNCKNHIRNKQEVDVCGWHVETLTNLGLVLEKTIDLPARGMRRGTNRESRVECEKLFVFHKP
jgi:hypothetical protein